jgi:GTPase SAR1 family protein
MIDEETRKSVANSVARNKKFVDEHTGDYVSKNYGIPKKATFPQKQDQDVHLKLVVVGDVGVGKTALLQTKMNGSFPTYLPTVCDGHSEQMSVDNYNIQIGFWG